MKNTIILIVTVLLLVTKTQAQKSVPSATEIMNNAFVKASAEHKNIMLIFHASWCGWCKKMEAAINDKSCKEIFERNYKIVLMDVLEFEENKQLENAGALDLLKKYRGENSGLPFWVILDAKGNLLADSKVRPTGASLEVDGKSIGCPNHPEEMKVFTDVLRRTSKLNDQDIQVIKQAFIKHTRTDNTAPHR